MTDKSKFLLTTLIASCFTASAYVVYALGPKAPALDDTKAWALALLVFIGVTIITIILSQIIIRIAVSIGIAVRNQNKGDEEVEKIISISMREDEMDKQISLNGIRVSSIFAGFGSVAALLLLAIGGEVVFDLHLIFGAYFVGGIAEAIVSIYYYEKGL